MSKKNVENIKTGVIIVLALVVVFGGSFYASEMKGCIKNENHTNSNGNTNITEDDNSSNDISSDIPEDEQKDLHEISIDDYLSLKDGEDKAIIYIARPTCYYCTQQEPIMKNIVFEKDITVNYLDTDKLDDDGQAKLIKSDDYFSEGYGTPITLIVQDGKIIDKSEGLTSKDALLELFKKHDFISE